MKDRYDQKSDFEYAVRCFNYCKEKLGANPENKEVRINFKSAKENLEKVTAQYNEWAINNPHFSLDDFINVYGRDQYHMEIEFHPISESFKKYGSSITALLDRHRFNTELYLKITEKPGNVKLHGRVFVKDVIDHELTNQDLTDLLENGFDSREVFWVGLSPEYSTTDQPECCKC